MQNYLDLELQQVWRYSKFSLSGNTSTSMCEPKPTWMYPTNKYWVCMKPDFSKTIQNIGRYSLEHQMWINPPLKIVPMKCTISF